MPEMDNKATWPGWETVRLIGRGSFGAVYEIQRDVFGETERAALKVITIPENGADIDDLRVEGYDDESITSRFQSYLEDIVKEYSTMAKMKGHPNVVYCDDVKYVQHDDGIGWDIYIKMELLTPIMKCLDQVENEQAVIDLGIAMCNALVLCKERNIVHRDIKPQNIFVSRGGTFKLGDFGIAKTAERTTSGTKVGTYKYMAPEVYNNKPYGPAADQYSLGLVMYWLLNDRRSPFSPKKATASEEDLARKRRFDGEQIPPPAHGSKQLQAIVLKACAYDPKDRFASAAEMLEALQLLKNSFTATGRPHLSISTQTDKDAGTVGTGVGQEQRALPSTVPATTPEGYGMVGVFDRRSQTASAATQNGASASFNDEERTIGAFGRSIPKQPSQEAPEPSGEARKAAQTTLTEKSASKAIPADTPAQNSNAALLKVKKKPMAPLIAAIAAVLVIVIGLVIWKPWVSEEERLQSDASKLSSIRETIQAPTEKVKTETNPPATNAPAVTTDMKVAMVTDYGDITDESFNQATYEGAKAWCEANGVDFTYYKPTVDSTEARVASIEQAVSEGYNVLLMPGFAFAGAIVETVENYPDVKFVALDVSEYDLQDAKGTAADFSWKYPTNLYSTVYKEELAGYMAGVAAVKLGYTKIGYLGGMAVPAVVRYGYGFVQGVNDAAKELGKVGEIELKYVYGNQFYGDADITAYMDTWYNAGTEVVFACGGGIYSSAAEAAQKVHGKVIGVDVDQKPTIDSKYEDGMTVTSAMKGLAATVKSLLGQIKDGKFEGGKVESLGLVSATPTDNYVQLPASTQWADGFTEADYNALVAALFKGEIKVHANTENAPVVAIAVDYQGNIK